MNTANAMPPANDKAPNTVAESESALLDRCRHGDGRAWDELFNLHYPATARFVTRLAYRFRQEDVEEICQETFLTVIRHLHRFKGQSRFQTWLFRIAANKARDLSQKQRAAKRGGGTVPIPIHSDTPTPAADPPSLLPSPDHDLIRSEESLLVSQALEQLPSPNRRILELRYFAELSYDEISRVLKLNPKTVSSRLSKSLDKLERLVGRLQNPAQEEGTFVTKS